MNRADFMQQLESLLQNISDGEREEAIQYYNDYFDDAGEENEQDVLEALGTPAKVAENIKENTYDNYSGYSDSSTGYSIQKRENKLSPIVIILIVIACVLTAPAILGVVTGVLGTLFGVIAAWFSLILAFGIVAVALLGVMLVLAVVGIMCMTTDVMAGIFMLGGGLVCGGLGILFLMLTVAMAGIATPAIFRGVEALCRLITKKIKRG